VATWVWLIRIDFRGVCTAAHPREVKLCLREGPGALEQNCILGVAGDFAEELV
jgi:hypothetical protein